jgi:hypothetical protein
MRSDGGDVGVVPASIAGAWMRVVEGMQSPRVERVLRALVVAGSIFVVLLAVYAAVRRMRYPFDLEWVESGVLVSVGRLVHHQSLYARPTLDYVPFLYAPLYFYVCAFVAKWTGVTFFTLRLVSTVSSVAALGVLFGFVYRETRSGFAAIAAVGLFASLYAFVGAWFDVGRVDSLFLLLFVAALYCTRFGPPVLAAAVWVLAFQTKQSAIAIAIPFLLTYWEPRRKSRVVVALGTYAVLAYGSIRLLNHASGGWYSFYVFGATKGLPMVARLAAMYVPEVVLAPLALAVVLIVASVLVRPPRLRTRAAIFYMVGTVFTLVAFWWVHAHRGVGNSMEVLYLWVALVFGIALERLLGRLASSRSGETAGMAGAAIAVVLLGVLAQLGSQVYNPGQFVPSAAVLADRQAFEAQLERIPGPVYVVNHGFDAVLAGKQPQADGEAVGAVVDSKGPDAQRFMEELHVAALSHKWSAIAVDDGYLAYHGWLTPEELAAYPVSVAAAGSSDARFLTSQPWKILLPCSALESGLAEQLSPEGTAPAAAGCAGAGKQ